MDVNKVKMINKWPLDDTSKDSNIEPLIMHYQLIAEEYCHRDFPDPLPSKVQQFIAKSIARDFTQQSGLSSRSMGSVSYSYDSDTDEKLNAIIRPLRRVNWGGAYVHE